jgi:hypothetical protein
MPITRLIDFLAPCFRITAMQSAMNQLLQKQCLADAKTHWENEAKLAARYENYD